MNRILYVLIGGSVAVAMASAFVARQGARPISETDVAVVAAFIALLAVAAFILARTRWGRKIDWRFRRMLNGRDAEVRANARNKGEVRKPPWWYW
jgi:hypothetical protein